MHKVAVSSREFLTVLRFPTVVIFYFPDFWRRSRVTDKKYASETTKERSRDQSFQFRTQTKDSDRRVTIDRLESHSTLANIKSKKQLEK